MLDTKLKNRHKLAVVLIIFIIMIPTIVITEQYGNVYYDMTEIREASENIEQTSGDFMGKFVDICYILYNSETDGGRREHAAEFAECLENEGYRSGYDEYYESFISLLDYRVVDGSGNVVAKTMASSDSSYPTEQNMGEYAIGVVISYDASGRPAAVIREGEYKQVQSKELNRILNNFSESSALVQWFQVMESESVLETPKDRTYYLAMRAESMEEYFRSQESWGAEYCVPSWFYQVMLFLMVLVAAAAILLPKRKNLHTGDEKIFRVPIEIPLIVFSVAVTGAVNMVENRIFSQEGSVSGVDTWIWFGVFAAVYWSAACTRRVFVIGPKKYMKECTLTAPVVRGVKKAWKLLVRKCKDGFDYLYHSFDNLDFAEKNNKTILRLVLINFGILFLVTCMWFAGIPALIFYSVVLFYILRKYFNDLKDKYAVLLKATNQMAQGKLDVEISEDLGVFNPFKAEIAKIQDGYLKAVEKEVKSQRMKTDLITNVSHDLKTPLTAIITYVNLLKEEKDEKKRQDYIDVLERKSLRLKVLIEDLFEISKASSKNVTLHLVDVDVVNLFKQVRLELSEKFKETELDFRCTYPDERAVAKLDSQKTYRIFENLLVNVVKYALPKTRVYVKIERIDEEVVLHIMNISATELNFNADEITERFVRGDAARNTEGSGLGLAIAKSFTELQKGRFKIETEGDLFKAEVAFSVEE